MNRRDVLKTLPAAWVASAAAQTRSAGKARLRTAICAYSFRKELAAKTMTYEDLVRLAVELETDGLDLTVYWFPNTSDDFLLPLRRAAFRNAVEIYSISVRTELTKPAGAEREKQLADLRNWVDVANKLGAGHIRVFGGAVPKGVTEEQAAGWVVESLKPAAEYAGSKGIVLGLENHGGVTEKASTIVSIVKQVNSPSVGVNLDTGNFNGDAYNQIGTILPYAVNTQFKTHIREQKGQSQPSDWPRIVGMLRNAGYRGYLALEYEDKEDATVAVPRLTRELNKIVRQA